MVTGVYLTQSRTNSPALLETLPAALGRWLLAPDPVTTHLATLALLVAAAALGVRAAIGALPVAELLADRGGGQTREDRVEQTRRLLGWAGGVALAAAPVVFLTELVVGSAGLSQAAGASGYRLLVALSTAPGLRLLLVAATAIAVPLVVAVRLLRWVAQGSVATFANRLGPFVGGVVITAGAVIVARPVVRGLVGWVAGKLPAPFSSAFRETAGVFVDFYGAPTIVVLLAAVLVALTATFALLFRVGVVAGYLSGETAGYSLASGGLFVATAFAGTAGASPWLVFGGLVGSFLVWDTGRYGTTLGKEIGRHAPTRDAELVHAGGTLAVGFLGAGLAYGIATTMESGLSAGSPTSVVALLGVLVGIVFLVAALR
jgi:hypothetical protein